MNTIKKLMLAACVAAVGLCGTAWAEPASESDFDFDLATGTITGYKGAGGDVEIPAQIGGVTVTAIGEFAFDKKALTGVVIPASVTNIGKRAFRQCDGLTSVTFGYGSQLKTIGMAVFYGCPLTDIMLPDALTDIGEEAFFECGSLTNVTFGAGSQLKHIGDQVFGVNIALTSVTIPAGVTNIGEMAFGACSKLEEVTVLATEPPTAGELLFDADGTGASGTIASLKAIKVPAESVEKYKETAGWSAYADLITDGSVEPVEYFAWDETEKKLVAQTCSAYTVMTTDTATLTSGWYVVQGAVTNTTGGIVVNGDAHLILADGAELVVTGAEERAGIEVGAVVSVNNSLTVYGQAGQTGRILVGGGEGGAGIGGGYGESCGIVTINGGAVTATSGEGGAGIGGGYYYADGGKVTINGGTVNATAIDRTYYSGAGIGGGCGGNGDTVTVNGGKVTAISCYLGAGIGGGMSGSGGSFTITAGDVTAIAYMIDSGKGGYYISSGIGMGVMAYDDQRPGSFALGPITVAEIDAGYYYSADLIDTIPVTEEEFEIWTEYPYVHITAAKAPLGAPKNPWPVLDENGAPTGWSAYTNGTGEVFFTGEGPLPDGFAGKPPFSELLPNAPKIFVPEGQKDPFEEALSEYAEKLFEKKDPIDYLFWDATERQLVAATCTDYTTVTPEMTTLTSGWYVVKRAVAIDRSAEDKPGLAVDGDAHLILVDGAELVVTGAHNYAGIEVGVAGSVTNSLTIYGQEGQTGRLTAAGGSSGAGIGGNFEQSCGIVTIDGGDVTATVVDDELGYFYAAGIGGGGHQSGGTVTINGGRVTAFGSGGGAAIGSGGVEAKAPSMVPGGSVVVINGGEVRATGDAVGIGGGEHCEAGSVTINGGNVTAIGGQLDAGIGNGAYSAPWTVTINGGNVTAMSCEVDDGLFGGIGAGIGGSAPSSGCHVKINGGEVTAITYPIDGGADLGVVLGDGIGAGYNLSDPTTPLDPGTFTLDYPGAYIYAGMDTNGVEVTEVQAGGFATWHTNCYVRITQTKRPDPIEYLAWDEDEEKLVTRTCWRYAVMEPGTKRLYGGWYAVTSAVTNTTGGIIVDGNAHLILCDGAELVATGGDISPGITVQDDGTIQRSLSIYGQKLGTGRLEAQGDDYCTGIGSGVGDIDDLVVSAPVTINGGMVMAVGGALGAGIGGSYGGNAGAITINGGTVNATGNGAGDDYYSGAGIGGGYGGDGGPVTINGGTVSACGSYLGAGIGGGTFGSGGDVTINAGEVTAFSYVWESGNGNIAGNCIGKGVTGSSTVTEPGSFALGPTTVAGIQVSTYADGRTLLDVEVADFLFWRQYPYVHVTAAKASPEVKIVSAKSERPGGEWNGTAQVVYSLENLDAAKTYELAVEILAAGQFAAKTNDIAPVSGIYTQEVNRTEFFGTGSTVEDREAQLTLKLIEK